MSEKPPPKPADIPRKPSAAEERDRAIARLADALTDYVQVLTDDAAGDKPPAWTAFRHVREGERLPSWDPANDLVIAVKGPDVGMIGPLVGLVHRNETRPLEGGVMSKDDFPDLYAAIGDRYCTGMEDGDLFRLPDLQGRGRR